MLPAIAREPSARLRDIAATCRITERTAPRIVSDLEEAGYLSRERDGRRTAVHPSPGGRTPSSGRSPRARSEPAGPLHSP
ncbi:MarR family winged helix-turn-helix transcriptional regulator [Streptomyces sp. NPDC007205]|uniref:MarR family winged helix-turn-helix transcriptional regulator n=1 Tax=Streptomyces sp. NPDC007205 TaxID=3154316 RepID=UPI00340D20BA